MTFEEQQKIIEMGRNAEALKDNPALEACMTLTMEELFARWLSTGPDDYNERDSIWGTAQALKAFKSSLDTFISSGAIERRNKEDLNGTVRN